MSESAVPLSNTVSNDWIDEPGVVRPLLRLAAPVLAEQFLAMLVGFSDTILTGHYLAKEQLAAITLMAYVLWMVYGLFSIVALGATALVARYFGAGKFNLARVVVHQAFLVGAVVTLLGFAVAVPFGDRFIALLQLKGESAASAVRYFHIILPVLPCVMINSVVIASLRGAGDMVRGLIVMGIVNLVNIAASWVLCLGLFGLPELGWRGIALGTACGYAVGSLVSMGMLVFGKTGLYLRVRDFRPDLRLIRKLLWVGVPGGTEMATVIVCQLWFLSVINSLGDTAAAAHGVAIRVESLAFLPGAAFQLAAATMAGQYLGAKMFDKANRSVLAACGIGGGIMLLAASVFFTAAPQLAALIAGGKNAEVVQTAAPLLRTVALGIPALASVMILSGALRGAGDTRWPLFVSMLGLLGIRIPLAYWLALPEFTIPWIGLTVAAKGMGVWGAWCAMVIDLWVRAVLIFRRFQHGGWKHIEL